jgi:Ca2+-binding EF-hand superfamily protein
MSYRDQDNRGHILANRPASKAAIDNQATQGWDKFEEPPASTGAKREVQSVLLQRRAKARELAEKPQGRPEDHAGAQSARRELLKPPHGGGVPPYDVSSAQQPLPTRGMSNAYGAFATQPPARQAFVVPPMPAPFDQIPPMRQEAAKEVFGSFAPAAQVPDSKHITHLQPSASDAKPAPAPKVSGAVLDPQTADRLLDAATSAVPTGIGSALKPGEAEAAAKAAQAQRNPLIAGGTTKNAAPPAQQKKPSPFHVETANQPLPKQSPSGGSVAQAPGLPPRPLTARALLQVDTWKFPCPSDCTSNPEYRGPQKKDPYISKWINDQETFREAREDQQELFDEIPSAGATTTATPAPILPVGTQLEVMPNGQLKLVDPAAQADAAPRGPLTAQALLAPKPTVNKQVEAKLHTALPFTTTAVPVNSAVVQSVGGPPPTSIGKRTLDAIKREREATGKARWLLEAPARAEALQRQLDVIVTSLRKSVEAKGFAEPSKGAQFIAKVCRQQTSLPGDEMDFAGFCDALAKGFNQSLTEEQLEALFDRLDVDSRTVLSFRDFGDHVFGVHTGSSSPPKKHKSMLAWVSNPKARALLEDIKTRIMRRHSGDAWLLAFSTAFRIMRGEVGSGGEIDADSLCRGLTRMGIGCTLHECKDLVAALDENRSGRVSEEEFLRAMRGPMSRLRRELVFKAFMILDTDKSGAVSLKEMAEKYDATKHPRVLSGEVKAEVILAEFMRLWNKDGDEKISWAEFLDYYSTISACVENNEYFELMMRNCWHMSGGTGAAANTTCRRVLVTFMDDSQRVCEIENDLGIGPRDMDKMKARLESQGIHNIKKIDLYG